MSMFCFQCQEAAGGKGCSIKGVCGKEESTANLQDLLIYVSKGISVISTQLRSKDIEFDKELVDKYIMEALFVTITNANFDNAAILNKIKEGLKIRSEISKLTSIENPHDCVTWTPNSDQDFYNKSNTIGVLDTENEDVRSLRELVIYGLKGMAAYAEHAINLKFSKDEIGEFAQRALAATLDDSLSVDELVSLVLETGKNGVEVMALLDSAHTSTFGNPEITEVNLGVRSNPGILVSGHDLTDMKQLLEQTKGTGVDIYTHSEMLPTHYYPEFKKYDHLVGNYGNAWWKQREEFPTFNGPILFTTNCIVPPKKGVEYAGKIFTTGSSGLEGATHIFPDENGKKDFSPIIEMAKNSKPPQEIESGKIIGGFAHNQVISLADKVVEGVKSGAIKKFFVMGGCDGRMKSRDYYKEFAEKLPNDTIILTAGCAKYRYNKLNLGDIGGIPRVLDAGQCNDSYSLAVIALKLKEVFELDDVNDLPIAYNIAWYEQKAVIVLLALLYLGVKNIHLGPTLPAFLSPNVAKVLVETFGISGIGDPDDDVKQFMSA
ncbi:MAG: hydroxylamine reductase [Candidatus Cloacimonadota bacterium]|nr:MAG: hydroxylamine reductase [Candidatus Cloacimonadota bacterium]PIE77691.1 MAG: hydroxylamine reductase [Candidatus Delongbacteria bacterium]